MNTLTKTEIALLMTLVANKIAYLEKNELDAKDLYQLLIKLGTLLQTPA